ncbi:MAG TPA: phospholipase [Paludibacteraceae bacterium]|nr:phospholipase [Paludibacteraceae bacterium]HQF49310.1 phospholipase [Paludibacteraceae bacterium]HQJ89019.1 phospholipase [Paludibacteraceae bacterium]
MSDFILFLIFVLVCVTYYIVDKKRKQKTSESVHEEDNTKTQVEETSKPKRNDIDGCCGAHEVCEKETLLNAKVQPDYYDDEELDAYVGRPSNSYNMDEQKQFEDIFYTLKEYDVAGWLRSLQLRNIELPDSLKDEALLVVSEPRFSNK